ncbi:hypothetical protein, partial [Paenibacillus cisolokensis]|uniref:hypothetical protein n=1 Tax=Paenibacillus cisolokensis TaxID=1658519 RepID=UPI001BCFEC08
MCISKRRELPLPSGRYGCIFPKNGKLYRRADIGEDNKIEIIDGEAYFFSGDMMLINNVKKQFKTQSDRSFKTLIDIARTVFEQHADEGDELAFAKYGFDNDGKATIEFTNNWLKFKAFKEYGNRKILFMTYGSKMKEAGEELRKYLHITDIKPKFFIPIYEAVADAGVGKELIVFHLTPDKWGRTKKIPLNEPDNFLKVDLGRLKQHYTFVGKGSDSWPVAIYGEGDGAKSFDNNNAFHPDMVGESMSGRGFITKPDDSFNIFYYSSNYGSERTIRLDNYGIFFLAEDGSIKFEHVTGTFFEITRNGNSIKMRSSPFLC